MTLDLIFAGIFLFFWLVFFILIRETHKIGYRARDLGAFWITIISLSLASLALLTSIVLELT